MLLIVMKPYHQCLVLAPELAAMSSSSATPNQVDTCHLLAKYPVLHKSGEHHASYSWLNPQVLMWPCETLTPVMKVDVSVQRTLTSVGFLFCNLTDATPCISRVPIL